MKRFISLFMIICLLVSVTASTHISVNAIDNSSPASATADESDMVSVGADCDHEGDEIQNTGDDVDSDEEFLESFNEVNIGDTITGSDAYMIKFTPDRDMIVKLFHRIHPQWPKAFVNSRDNIVESLYEESEAYGAEEKYQFYLYSVKANETFYYYSVDSGYYWNGEENENYSVSVEEFTDFSDVELGKTFEFDCEDDSRYYFFRFTPSDDMLVRLSDNSEGYFEFLIQGSSKIIGNSYYYKHSKVYQLTAGKDYIITCKYYYSKSYPDPAGRVRFRLDPVESIGFEETKTTQNDSEFDFFRVYAYNPDKDMFIKVITSDISEITDRKNHFTDLVSVSGRDSGRNRSARNEARINTRVKAGETYLLASYFTNSEPGSSKVRIEEYTPETIGINDVITVKSGNYENEYYVFESDSDREIMLERAYGNNVMLLNEDLTSVTQFNYGAATPFFRINKGEKYYIWAERKYKEFTYRLSVIVPKALKPNDNINIPASTYGYTFYSVKPDENMIVSIAFLNETKAYPELFTADREKVKMFSKNDYTVDYNTFRKTYTGKTYYAILQKDEEYLFDVYIDDDNYQNNIAVDSVFKKIDFKDIQLDEYQSLYNHVPDDYMFFRFKPTENMLLKKTITRDEDDERDVSFTLYDEDFNVLSSNFDSYSYYVTAGKQYYFIGKTTFDMYCDDLDCGVTLSAQEMKTIEPDGTATLNYGDCVKFTADRDLVIGFKSASESFDSTVYLFDADFNQLDYYMSSYLSSDDYLLLEAGDVYYIRKIRGNESSEIEAHLLSYIEPFGLNEEKIIDIKEEDDIRLFSFTPENDMEIEIISNNDYNVDFSPVVHIQEDRPVISWDTNVISSQLSINKELIGGKTYYISATVYHGSSSYYEHTGTYKLKMRDAGLICVDDPVKLMDYDSDCIEKEFDFTPDKDALIKCSASSYYINASGCYVCVTDPSGSIIAEEESDDNFELLFEVKKGLTYKIKVRFESDGDYVSGNVILDEIEDIHLGEEFTHPGFYRFIPQKNVIPAIMATLADGTRFYDEIYVRDSEFGYLHGRNSFGGDFFELQAGNTYYFDIRDDYFENEEYDDDEDYDEYDYDNDKPNYASIVLSEPEEIKPGETKNLSLSEEGFWLYQISCNEDTIVEFNGKGSGKVLAALKDTSGNVYKNHSGSDGELFSIGYTISAGRKMLLTINAYSDTEGTVTADPCGEFKIVDNKLVKYYGDNPEPDIPDVTAIEACAFLYTDSLKKAVVPDSVTEIGESAFARCYSLESVTIPGTVKSINTHTFDFDDKLSEVLLGEGLTEICDSAFLVCPSLSYIKLPESLTTIGKNAFYDCRGLKQITIPKNVTHIGDKAFGYYSDYWDGVMKIENFEIRGYKGTAAEQYANDNGFRFIDIDEILSNPIPGDVTDDGKVDAADIDALQKFLNQWDVSINEQNADVNNDGKVNMQDIVLIRQYLNGWDVELI